MTSRARGGSTAAVCGLLVAVLTGAALPGCAGQRSRRDAERAVREYNDGLVVAYRTNDPRGLEKVAGEKEVLRLIALIDLKRSENLVLESKVEEVEVLGVDEVPPDGMVVRTRERWRYWDRPLKPGMPAGPVFVADMWMRWTLERRDGRWRVAGGTTERSLYLEPKGHEPGRARTPEPSPSTAPSPGKAGA